MVYLNVDDNGYLLSVSSGGDGPGLENLEDLDLSGERINAYRWDGEKLILDENKLDTLEKEHAEVARQEKIRELTIALRETDETVLEAIEGLLSATTAAQLLTAIKKASADLAEVLSYRKELRNQMKEE